ncbi:MAG: nickel insertion protein, partial [Hyphomicrobiaceae bacterium]
CTSVQIIANPDTAIDLARLIFDETTTLGIRRSNCERFVVNRHVVATSQGARVKVAQRPAGETAKIEQDDLSEVRTARSRELMRREAERQALEDDGKND